MSGTLFGRTTARALGRMWVGMAPHRHKKDTASRDLLTGPARPAVPHSIETSAQQRFEPDHCANCLQPLPQQMEKLFCCELCRQTAKVIRYWRSVVRDGRIENPEVRDALHTKVAHLLGGGYNESARRLSPAVRKQVWERDQGRCRQCHQPGEEIDHIDGDSAALTNLQVLCKVCHHRKTQERMVPASVDQQCMIETLYQERVVPDEPILLCDDQHQWRKVEPRLRTDRRWRVRGASVGAHVDD